MVKIKDLYKTDESSRYNHLTSFFKQNEVEKTVGKIRYFSTSGRCELGGNHTDHNKGKTLACSINLDTIAAVKETSDNKVYLISEGFPPVIVDLADIRYKSTEEGTTLALVKGICNAFIDKDVKLRGFIACTTSKVFKGSGVSSSAAIEVLVATILNVLFNDSKFDTTTLALIGQYSENKYFGKPSGLLDQLACSNKAISYMNFESELPIIKNINFDFDKRGYSLVVVALKGDHSNLTDAYTAIVTEMRLVSNFFNKDVLSAVDENEFYNKISEIRDKLKNDRAITRAIHFFEENKRVEAMLNALKADDLESYLNLVNESGNSSALLLQNIYANPFNQDLSIALGVAKSLLQGKGACRVHGGGFAGTIFAYVPKSSYKHFITQMNQSLGYEACHQIIVRQYQTTEVQL